MRGAGRGAGSLAYFIGDEGAAWFVSNARYERMRAHAGDVSDTAQAPNGSPDSVGPLLKAYRVLFEDYFAVD